MHEATHEQQQFWEQGIGLARTYTKFHEIQSCAMEFLFFLEKSNIIGPDYAASMNPADVDLAKRFKKDGIYVFKQDITVNSYPKVRSLDAHTSDKFEELVVLEKLIADRKKKAKNDFAGENMAEASRLTLEDAAAKKASWDQVKTNGINKYIKAHLAWYKAYNKKSIEDQIYILEQWEKLSEQ